MADEYDVIPPVTGPAQGPEAIDVVRVGTVNLSPVTSLSEAESTRMFRGFASSSPDPVMERYLPAILPGLSSLPSWMILSRYVQDSTRTRLAVTRIIPVAKSSAATETISITKSSLIRHITIIPERKVVSRG